MSISRKLDREIIGKYAIIAWAETQCDWLLDMLAEYFTAE